MKRSIPFGAVGVLDELVVTQQKAIGSPFGKVTVKRFLDL